MAKLVVCFDGTWNKPTDDHDGGKNTDTNVWRLYESIEGTPVADYTEGAALCNDTLKWYDKGVGTEWYTHIRGGAFGYGLSLNIRQGYKFLIDYYRPGDEIHIFGFSRGAYTARSLVGLIRNSGLLDREKLVQSDPKYPCWFPPATAAEFRCLATDDVPQIMDAYQLYRNRDGGADTDFAIDFRKRYAFNDVKVKFLGVWDTVGALGIPFKVFEGFNSEHYRFHDEELSGIVENAYHAIAIDEHREDYAVALWNPVRKVNQTLEQVWFVGAHADVGGGYKPPRPLADATLAWMQQKINKVNTLRITTAPVVDEEQLKQVSPTDSFRDFMCGIYRMIKNPYYRTLGSTQYGNEALSKVCTVIEGYAPKNEGFGKLLVKEGDS